MFDKTCATDVTKIYVFRKLFIVVCVNKMTVGKLPDNGENAEKCRS